MIGVTIGALGMLAGYFAAALKRWRRQQGCAARLSPLIFAGGDRYLGQSLPHLTCIIGVLGIPAFMRVARAATLTLARRELRAQRWRDACAHPLRVCPMSFAVGCLFSPRRCRHDRGRGPCPSCLAPPPIELGQHDRGARAGRRAEACLHSRDCDVSDLLSFNPVCDTRELLTDPRQGAVTEPALLSSRMCRSIWDPARQSPRGGSGRFRIGRPDAGYCRRVGCGKTMPSRAILQLLPSKTFRPRDV
jgi:hypothetical protein